MENTMRKEGATDVWHNTKVDICKNCGGKGKRLVYVGGSRENDREWQSCETCQGSGMVTKELVVNIFPHKL